MMVIKSSEERARERSLCVPTSKLLYVAGETAQWLGMLTEDVGSVPSPTQEYLRKLTLTTHQEMSKMPIPENVEI